MYNVLLSYLQKLHFNQDFAVYVAFLIILFGIILITLLINWILKTYIVRFVHKFASRTSKKIGPVLESHAVFSKLSQLGAAIFLAIAISAVSYSELAFTTQFVSIVRALSVIYALLIIMITFGRVLDAVNTYSAHIVYLRNKPVRSYLQIIRIIGWIVTIVCAISLLMDKSPLVFLTSLGAISALIIVVFKDTILGFVASLQVSAYDSVRVGDWITIQDKGVDGTVLDVAVNTVKVQNFDNTIITIPTYDLVSSSVQNWRGMTESGGRRIKRSILIDIDTIKFCDKSLLEQLSKLELLKEYLQERQKEIEKHNLKYGVDKSIPANGRELTNIGLFRAYIKAYLNVNNKIRKDMTFLVRQLDPSATGIPLEVYVFTKDTDSVSYEDVQSDIFDHLLATLRLFGLRAFQFSTHYTEKLL